MPNVSDAMSSTIDLSALHLGDVALASLLTALLTLVICLIAIRVITTLLHRILEKTPLDKRLQKYALSTLRCVMWIIATLIVAEKLGIPMTSLVALLSVLSLAVSLAVQNVLSNIAGGLIILITKPFKIGDFIECDDGTGTVKEINLTYTHLDTFDGLRISIPNSNLSAGKIINYTARGQRRVEHTVTASYDAAVTDVRRACLSAINRTAAVINAPAPEVYVNSYGESSIQYVVRCWCDAADYWDVYFGLLENIKVAFDENNIEMTYNHLNVHILEK
ncbi:MAG: mechanosensitive ion channel family protein [Clostridiales bacterium]|nr:mechanosensitive ion channel family protein [Candidatus Cacconaster stercorequi]